MDAAVARMKTCGLNINASKCSTLNIATNAKKNQWACNPAAFFCFADDSPLPPTTITAAYRYLGIDIGITNGILNTSSDLQARLNYVTKARLKPAQRVYILRTHLILRYQHCHTLAETTKKSLKYLDVLIRGAVSSWFRLPKDTSLGVFYASCRIGGLGLQSFKRHMFCKNNPTSK